MDIGGRDRALVTHYTANNEASRLDRKEGLVEFNRTRSILGSALPAGSVVLDVGGAQGVHAEWLTAEGHDVEVIDIVPLHVQQAADRGLNARLGDARDLPHQDSSVDAVLLLGPLYHLLNDEDRARALAEARRVTRPGGLLAVAAISRLAVALDFLRRGRLEEPGAVGMVASIVRNGVDTTGFGNGVFYFHTVLELRGEMEAAGFADVTIRGLEGPGWPLIEPDAENTAVISQVELIAELADTEAFTAGASAHLLALGTVQAT